jgi:hypothetical protein
LILQKDPQKALARRIVLLDLFIKRAREMKGETDPGKEKVLGKGDNRDIVGDVPFHNTSATV